jgi:hypothetical protein
LEVPTQSEPVSPPPMTMTCLPLTLIGLALSLLDFLVLRNQEFQRGVDALQLAARNRQIARHFGTGGEDHGIEILLQLLGGNEFAGIVVDAGRHVLVANQRPWS